MRSFFTPPKVSNIRNLGTIKGRVTIYTATITHPGRQPSVYQFVGPTKGTGPVTMFTRGGLTEHTILKPSRYGAFGPDWIRNYFSVPHL